MSIKSVLYYILILSFFFQCKSEENKNDSLIAKVYDQELHKSDLADLLGDGPLSEDDKKQAVDTWIRKQLYLKNASLGSSQKKEIDNLIENYRESLVIQKHKENYIDRNLKKDLSEDELLADYNKMKDSYKLKSTIYKIEVVVTPADHFDKLDLKNFFKKGEIEEWRNSLDNLIDLHVQDTMKWYTWKQISQYIPSDLIKEEDIDDEDDYFLENDQHLFFVRVYEIVDKNEIAPLSYMRDKIERAVLEDRKQKLLTDYSTELYKTALKNNQLKISED